MWRKNLVDSTRQLKLGTGADRARQRSDLALIDGTEVVRAGGSVGLTGDRA